MIIDFYETFYNKDGNNGKNDLKKLVDVLIPCSVKFYKSLDKEEVTELLEKMQNINQRITPKIEA